MTAPASGLMRAMQNQAADGVIGFLASSVVGAALRALHVLAIMDARSDQKSLLSFVLSGLCGVDGWSVSLAWVARTTTLSQFMIRSSIDCRFTTPWLPAATQAFELQIRVNGLSITSPGASLRDHLVAHRRLVWPRDIHI